MTAVHPSSPLSNSGKQKSTSLKYTLQHPGPSPALKWMPDCPPPSIPMSTALFTDTFVLRVQHDQSPIAPPLMYVVYNTRQHADEQGDLCMYRKEYFIVEWCSVEWNEQGGLCKGKSMCFSVEWCGAFAMRYIHT